MDLADEPVHLVGDRAVGGVALAAGAQLDELHRLARVEVEHVANAEAEAEGVGGLAFAALAGEALPFRRRELVGAAHRVAAAGGLDLLGHAGAEVRSEALPLHGEHAMALEVAEGAVVGDDLEAVAQRLEAAPGAVAAVRARADEVGEQRGALVGAERAEAYARVLLAHARRLEQERSEQRVLVAVDVEQAHGRAGRPVVGLRVPVEPEPRDPALGRALARLEVGDPLAAPVRPIDARDEARDHRLDRVEHHAPVRARLGQRVREQVQDELLVRLARRVDAHVRERRGGQQAAQEVERLGLDGAPVRGARLAVRRRELRVGPRGDPRQAVGVDGEEFVHRARVRRPERGVAVVAVAAVAAAGHRRVVCDVARGLLEVGGKAGALEDLRQYVRDPLARDVHAAELRDRVVAVAEEDGLVELRGALTLAGVPRPVHLGQRVGELVEEQAPQRAGVARVAGEQRTLDGLGQVDEREHRPVEVRHVRREAGALGGGEGLDRIVHGAEEASARSGGLRCCVPLTRNSGAWRGRTALRGKGGARVRALLRTAACPAERAWAAFQTPAVWNSAHAGPRTIVGRKMPPVAAELGARPPTPRRNAPATGSPSPRSAVRGRRAAGKRRSGSPRAPSPQPPSAPRWLRRRPAWRRSLRMSSRNLTGMPWARAIASPFVRRSVSAAAAASCTAARTASSTFAEMRIAAPTPRRDRSTADAGDEPAARARSSDPGRQRPEESPMTPTLDRIDIVRRSYRAYETGDRAALEALLADDLVFSSPADVGIDRATYWERCWPNHENISAIAFKRLEAVGDDEVLVTYEAERTDGSRFRNTEVLGLTGDRIATVEVYFGWSL